MKLITHLYLVLGSKNAWSYTFTPPYVFMAWYLVKHRDFTLKVKVTLYMYLSTIP
jgi:hypothetical protein